MAGPRWTRAGRWSPRRGSGHALLLVAYVALLVTSAWAFLPSPLHHHHAPRKVVSHLLNAPAASAVDSLSEPMRPVQAANPFSEASPKHLTIKEKRKLASILRRDLHLSAKHVNVTGAFAAYMEMKKWELALELDDLNTLLYVCHKGNTGRTLDIYRDFLSANPHIRPDENTYALVVRTLTESGQVAEALEVTFQMMSDSIRPRLRTFTPILQELWARRDAHEARRVWDYMMELKVAPNDESIVGMIKCYGEAQMLLEVKQVDHTHKLLDLLSQTALNVSVAVLDDLVYAFNSTMDAVVTRIEIPGEGSGVCPHCQGALQPITLTTEERALLRSGLRRLADERAKPLPSFFRREGVEPPGHYSEVTLDTFHDWLRERPPFDVVLDAPNIAYYGQNHRRGCFNLFQVDAILKRFQGEGKRVLVMIPWKYTEKWVPNHCRRWSFQRRLSPEEEAILQRWYDEDLVYRVPITQYDDLYWMYATVADDDRPMLAVTNDRMRDHWVSLLEPRPFLRWKTTQVMRFSFARDMPWANTDSDYDTDNEQDEEDVSDEEGEEGEEDKRTTLSSSTSGTGGSDQVASGSSSNSTSSSGSSSSGGVTSAPPRPYQQFAVPDPEVGEVSFRHMHFSREGQETENGHIHLPSDVGDEWICIDMNRLRRQCQSDGTEK